MRKDNDPSRKQMSGRRMYKLTDKDRILFQTIFTFWFLGSAINYASQGRWWYTFFTILAAASCIYFGWRSYQRVVINKRERDDRDG